ncbi:hypothetical protein Egran_01133 [Elaphomyces granulatus]|uniref:Cwf18 pre-mRNA splicing factor n=1 Tax=Elaphomyces granulatus TaxID=519963 RepID=A0A232M3X4_9EURO|nr:hypothetical protein Egran_01133 [Elaphomyces granulatus]
MSSNHTSLEAAATERKARLAKLAALKRKQPETAPVGEAPFEDAQPADSTSDVVPSFLSGRNYDPETRGPRLGFEKAPTEGQITLEQQASGIATETAEQTREEEAADKPIDLFKLQPRKPNWDLKRHLDERMRILNVRTENALAKLVRQRIETAQRAARGRASMNNGEEQGEEFGIEGETLVEGIHVREQEEAKEEQGEMEDPI